MILDYTGIVNDVNHHIPSRLAPPATSGSLATVLSYCVLANTGFLLNTPCVVYILLLLNY